MEILKICLFGRKKTTEISVFSWNGVSIFSLNLISNFITLLIISNLIFTMNVIATKKCENLFCFYPRLHCKLVLLAGQGGTVNVYSFHLHWIYNLGARQGVIKRCRLSWLTHSDLLHESKMWGGMGEVAGKMSTAVYIKWHGAQINLGDLTPYLTYGMDKRFECAETH
jgi:hypothetical protein